MLQGVGGESDVRLYISDISSSLVCGVCGWVCVIIGCQHQTATETVKNEQIREGRVQITCALLRPSSVPFASAILSSAYACHHHDHQKVYWQVALCLWAQAEREEGKCCSLNL